MPLADVIRQPSPLAPAGAILAIDYGRKRLGLALSDENGMTSQPFATWTRTNRRRDLARLRDFVRKHAIRRIVVGLPLHLDGTPSEMSGEATLFAARVERALGVRVEMMDERLTSWEAGQTLKQTGSASRRGHTSGSEQKRKATLDHVAAAVILRDYLNHVRGAAGKRD